MKSGFEDFRYYFQCFPSTIKKFALLLPSFHKAGLMGCLAIDRNQILGLVKTTK
jgi:hypothetical protein